MQIQIPSLTQKTTCPCLPLKSQFRLLPLSSSHCNFQLNWTCCMFWSLQVLWHQGLLICCLLCLEDSRPLFYYLPALLPRSLFGKLLLTLLLKGLFRLTRPDLILDHPFPHNPLLSFHSGNRNCSSLSFLLDCKLNENRNHFFIPTVLGWQYMFNK